MWVCVILVFLVMILPWFFILTRVNFIHRIEKAASLYDTPNIFCLFPNSLTSPVVETQCLLRLKEPAVLLRCRKEDHHNVESVLHSAKGEYASKAEVREPEILVDHSVYLPPSPSYSDDDKHGQFW
jgi:hypothetical protein